MIYAQKMENVNAEDTEDRIFSLGENRSKYLLWFKGMCNYLLTLHEENPQNTFFFFLNAVFYDMCH